MSTSTLTNVWQDKAKCLGRPVNDYDLAIGKWKDKRGRAAQLCQGCPVIAECAQDVLERGVFGLVRAGLWFEGKAPIKQSKNPKTIRLRQLAEGADRG